MDGGDHFTGQMLPLGNRRSKLSAPGRVCKEEGCGTVLSRYNETDYCSLHNNPRKAKRIWMRADRWDDTEHTIASDESVIVARPKPDNRPSSVAATHKTGRTVPRELTVKPKRKRAK